MQSKLLRPYSAGEDILRPAPPRSLPVDVANVESVPATVQPVVDTVLEMILVEMVRVRKLLEVLVEIDSDNLI